MSSDLPTLVLRNRGLFISILVGFALLTNFGCGRSNGLERVPLVGQVTLDGLPLVAGQIRLLPKAPTAGPGVMAEIAGGQFVFTSATGPVAGEHRVEIEATGFTSFPIDDEAAFALAVQRTGRSPFARNPIPAVYNSHSVLAASVSGESKQELSFHLHSKPNTGLRTP